MPIPQSSRLKSTVLWRLWRLRATGHEKSLWLTGRYSAAIDRSKKVLASDPDFFRAHWVMGLALEQTGALAEAITELERAHQLSPTIGVALGGLAHCYGRSGRTQDAKLALRRLDNWTQRSCSGLALAHLGLGHKDEALEALEMACREKEFYVIGLGVDRRLDVLNVSPRFDAILKRVGLKK